MKLPKPRNLIIGIVIGLIVIVGVHVALTLRRAAASRAAQPPPANTASSATVGPRVDLGLLLALCAAALFAVGIAKSLELAFDSLLVPMLAAIPGLIAALALLAMRLRGSVAAVPWPKHEETKQIGLLGAGLAAIPFTGFFPALGAYLIAMLWSRSKLRLMIVPYAAAILLAVYGLSKGFRISLP